VVERAEELITRISQGDREALTDLYEQNRQSLLSYLRLLTSDNGLAEEILQDTLLAVWAGASNFGGRSSGRTWLFSIARRRARDLLRRRAVPLADLSVLTTIPSREPEPADAVMAGETTDALTNAFGRMSPAHQEVLNLTFVHGLSYQELSEVLNIPIGTVKSRLFSAKRELRERLNESEGPRR
jgi:RNA polymerase sigma-70 factor (ECF subfamily)